MFILMAVPQSTLTEMTILSTVTLKSSRALLKNNIAYKDSVSPRGFSLAESIDDI